MKTVAVLLAASLALAGCTSTSAVSNTTPATASPSASSWSNIASFSEATLTHDWDRAEKYASTDSPAAKYLTHQRAAHEAESSAGGSDTPIEENKIEYDEVAGTVTFPQNNTETVWGHFTLDDSGLITAWLINDENTPLAERLWTETPKATNPCAEVEVISAYRNESDLWIVLDVHAKSSSVSTQGSGLTYVGADKRQRDASLSLGPDDIRKGNSGYMVVSFTGADFGGALYFEIKDSDYDSHGTLKLEIR